MAEPNRLQQMKADEEMTCVSSRRTPNQKLEKLREAAKAVDDGKLVTPPAATAATSD